MSAPDTTKPIGIRNDWKDLDGKTSEGPSREKVECQGCGWKGRFHELLAVDDEDALWCPICECSGWCWR